MQLITILAIQISLMLVGVLAAISMGVKKKLEILGLSYLLGSGIVTILFLLLHWFFELRLDQLNFLLSFSLSIIFLLIINLLLKRIDIIKNLFKFNITNLFQKKSSIKKSIFFIILFLVTYSFFENYFWPIIDWDALAFYDFRAKVMALNGDMLEGIELKYFFQYPPYTSFLHVFGYIFGAERVKIAYSIITSSLLLNFFNLVRRKQSRLISLIFTLVLASTPMIFEHSITAYSNLPYVSFFSIGLIYLWIYFEKGTLKNLLIGGILIGFSNWIRSTEPFWIVGAILILLGIIKHKANFKTSAFLIAFLSFPNRIWRSFLTQLDNASQIKIIDTEPHAVSAIKDFLSQDRLVFDLVIRILEVLKYLIVTLAPDFLLLTMLLILTIITNYKNKRIEILSLILLFGIVFAGTLIFSFTFETWDLIGGSIVRMCMIFVPLILYIVAKDLKYEKKN